MDCASEESEIRRAVEGVPGVLGLRFQLGERSLRIAGELRYGRSGRVTLTDTTRKGRLNKGEDRPLHRGLLLRLAEVRGKVGGVEVALKCPPPDDFAATLKRLSRTH